MGYFLAYEDEVILVHACDKCNKHCIVTDKSNHKEYHFTKNKRVLINDDK